MAKLMTVEEYESELARVRSQGFSDRRGHQKWYEKNRKLENAIRDAATKCMAASTPDEAQQAMLDLLRRVPKNARKKWGWRS